MEARGICASYDIKNNAKRVITVNVQLVESIKQLIQALSPEEQNWLKAQLQDSDRPSPKIVDLNSFSGTIQLQQDPVEFQHQMRDGWA